MSRYQCPCGLGYFRFLTFPIVGTYCTACSCIRTVHDGETLTADWLARKAPVDLSGDIEFADGMDD